MSRLLLLGLKIEIRDVNRGQTNAKKKQRPQSLAFFWQGTIQPEPLRVTVSGINSMMQSFDSSTPQQQQQWRYPLYAVQKRINAVPLRSLSEDDQNLQFHNKLYFDARDRFRLFEIMKRNFGEWERFIKTLEDPKLRVRGDAMTELDRLMLNFLSSVNALFNHFRVHFCRFAVGDDSKRKFDNYVRNTLPGLEDCALQYIRAEPCLRLTNMMITIFTAIWGLCPSLLDGPLSA